MANRPGQKIKMTSIDELLCVPSTEGTTDIEVEAIYPFENHPFKVLDDEKMDELVESIKTNGILTPVIVRPDDEGTYEMISGHRRLHAAKRAGLRKVPAIVKEVTDDEATIMMVDANVQREEILPSEKAFAYKMRYDAMRRQGARTDLTSSQNGTKSKRSTSSQNETKSGLRADEELAALMGESRNQIQRYLRLTELIPELLDLVDEKKIPLMTAVEISFLSKQVQKWTYEYIRENGAIKWEMVTAFRREVDKENVTQHELISFYNSLKPVPSSKKKITLSERKLNQYFPGTMSVKDRGNLIYELLAKWKEEQAFEEDDE